MYISMTGISYKASKGDVIRAIATVLHSPEFQDERDPLQLSKYNFRVELEIADNMGGQTNGKGSLLLPTRELVERFLEWVKDKSRGIEVYGKRIGFEYNSGHRNETEMLQKLPWIPPEVEERRLSIIQQLSKYISIDSVEIGYIDRETAGKVFFHPEWKAPQRYSTLSMEYQYKTVRIQMGDPVKDYILHDIAIKFDNFKSIVVGADFMKHYVILELYNPAAYEWCEMADTERGKKNFRKRVSEFGFGHEIVAPYVWHIRLTFAVPDGRDDFVRFCRICSLKNPVLCKVPNDKISSYSPRQLHTIETWLINLDLRIAFQLEALVRNAQVTPAGLLSIKDVVSALIQKKGVVVASQVLRYLNSATGDRKPGQQSISSFLKQITSKREALDAPVPSGSMMHVHHVTFTPTSVRLSGPHISQSNRVLRKYASQQHSFLRVDFRDEESLQFRWTPDVDGTTFVEERIGDLLDNGFTLCGRHFEFLAYSTSALREHAVWFVTPFLDPEEGQVDANSIRTRLGNFSRSIQFPALYAARMAQAFTSTDPSVTLSNDESYQQWRVIGDITRGGYSHSDGVGTMSPKVAEMIWCSLTQEQGQLRQFSAKPSVVQIRAEGAKGVLVIDHFLEGIQLHLRESMMKFDPLDPEEKNIDIEVAKAFVTPSKMYLNRPLIQLLECLGVPPAVFLDLQKAAVDELEASKTSMAGFIKALQVYSLGIPFELAPVLKQLISTLQREKNGLDINTNAFGPFICGLVEYAILHALRALKYQARIPVPDSWNLVGVADEGYRYRKSGKSNIRVLRDREIFAAIREWGSDEITYIKGPAWITRSPQVHPGDVQMVYGVGKPVLKEGEECFFDKLVNCVVFSCNGGKRPLFNYLGGGDLDGDTYMICTHPPLLLPTAGRPPANYDQPSRAQVEKSTIKDVSNFVVQYINHDVSLLSHQLSVIVDQSRDGMFDDKCKKLAELCTIAVDFPKTGIAPQMDDIPKRYAPQKPDWTESETPNPFNTALGFYQSEKALGRLYRAITVEEAFVQPQISQPPGLPGSRGMSRITDMLQKLVVPHLPITSRAVAGKHEEIEKIWQQYVAELTHIAYTHAITSDATVRLEEHEIVLGTILAPSKQPRLRKEKIASLRLHSKELVKLVARKIGFLESEAERERNQRTLMRAWEAWHVSLMRQGEFGSSSFGLVALARILRALEMLTGRETGLTDWQGDPFYTGVIGEE